MKTELKTPTELHSLREAVTYFADADRALALMVEMRWPNGVTYPRCHADGPMFLKTRRIWKCSECRRQFSEKVGTMFEDSPLGLDKWLLALWSLFKRTLKEPYLSVEPFHFFRYVDEQVLRFNSRAGNDRQRFMAVAADALGKRLSYATLIGANLSAATTCGKNQAALPARPETRQA